MVFGEPDGGGLSAKRGIGSVAEAAGPVEVVNAPPLGVGA
jgi:hypothetical protein